ncbi:hypothetical protein RhiJN_19076 [Ceratobasidium sp. AG-Ba]|nr:hypothetical protein RhiJN_19076 [Ceratobasidium sp. AG-Ba]
MGSNWSAPSPTSPPPAPRRPRPVSSIELSGAASASAVERVVAHVKRVIAELGGPRFQSLVRLATCERFFAHVYAAYTPSAPPLPPQIEEAAKAAGCVDILCAPFTPDSVRKALTKVPPWSESLSIPQALAEPLEPISVPKIIPPISIREPSAKPLLSLASLPSASTSYQTQPLSVFQHVYFALSCATCSSASSPGRSCLLFLPACICISSSLCVRRRSVDVGGLALALSGVAGHGGGWGGWAGAEEELALGVPSGKVKAKAGATAPSGSTTLGTMASHLLSQMYTQTGAAVDGATSDISASPPPPSPYPSGRPHSASDPHIPFAYNTGITAPPTRPQPDPVKPKPSHPDDIGPTRREELIVLLDRWEFEPHKLSDADILGCAGLLFEAHFKLKAWRRMLVFILTKEEDGQSGKFVNRLGSETNKNDVFALLLAAVGHDVGHPGLSNAFMTNADTPLSRVFDHKSSLEQLHCALLLRLMHKHGMGHLLSSRPIPANNRPGIPVSNGSGLDLGGNLNATSTAGLGVNTGRIGLSPIRHPLAWHQRITK